MTTQPGYNEWRGKIENDGPMQLAERLVGAVAHGEPVLAVLGVDETAVLAVIDEGVRLLSDQAIRIIRFRSSPGSPLTLPDILHELGAVERGGLTADDDELIVRMLAKPNKSQGRMLLIFEQAELLPLRTLTFVQMISTVFDAVTPGLQILFAGQSGFKDIIGKDELAGLYGRLETIIQVSYRRADVNSSVSSPRRLSGGGWQGHRFIARQKKTTLVLLLGSIALVSAGVFAALQPDSNETARQAESIVAASSLPRAGPPTAGTIVQSSSQSPEPQLQPPSLPPQAAPPSRLATPPQPGGREPEQTTATSPTQRRSRPAGEQLTRLQGEFEHFLRQTEWGAKRQSDDERARLFNEFLQWNYGASNFGPETPSPVAAGSALSHARVTLHFRAGSTSGKGMALQVAATLRSMVGLARTRSVADVPKTYELRYFAQEDESLAATLAQMLQTPEATWTVRLMPSYRPMPLPHTIELWIPLR